MGACVKVHEADLGDFGMACTYAHSCCSHAFSMPRLVGTLLTLLTARMGRAGGMGDSTGMLGLIECVDYGTLDAWRRTSNQSMSGAL